MGFRRVVTGHDANGRSVFVADEFVDSVSPLPGSAFDKMWGCDTVPVVPNGGVAPPYGNFFGPPGTVRVLTWVAAPAGTAPDLDEATLAAAAAVMDRELPGLAGHMEPDHPGMHTSQTVDVDVILSGELFLELDDGAETHLRPGDVVIQNGTRHRWENRGSVPCVVLSVIVGAAQA